MFRDFKSLLNSLCGILSVHSQRPDSPEELAFVVLDPVNRPLAFFVARRSKGTHEYHRGFADLLKRKRRQMVGDVVAPLLLRRYRRRVQQLFGVLDTSCPDSRNLIFALGSAVGWSWRRCRVVFVIQIPLCHSTSIVSIATPGLNED